MLFGYARVSSLDQDVSIQINALKAIGCEVVRSEKVSGTSRDGRDELEMLLQFIREGDTLVVTRIDRLARSVRDLQNIVHDLRQRGINLKVTEQPIDTSTAAGKLFFDTLSAFAEFETALRRDRQRAGIEAAKKRGMYRGRKVLIDAAQVREMKAQGLGATAIAKALGIGRASVYRVL